MSKKMKGVSLDPSRYGSYEDAKARFKHQALMQDYKELQREAEAMRNKLENTKKRKLTLFAELRFLRRRYKYLVENKVVKPPQVREMAPRPNFKTQPKKNVKQKPSSKRRGNLQNIAKQKTVSHTVSDAIQKERMFVGGDLASRNLNQILDLKQQDMIHSGKATTLRNATPLLDLNQRERSYGRNEAAFWNPTPNLDLNRKERLNSGKETAPQTLFPAFDLNQRGRNIGSENTVQTRAPIFDLNQISGEEEELQDRYEPLKIEEPKKFVIRGGTDDQHNDLKLSACRRVGNGPNRPEKRKISWQDPVALEV